MSILNLGLQSIGLMRAQMNDELEKIMKKCNSMKDIREHSNNESQLKEGLMESLQSPISLMENIFERLSLKDEYFKTFKAAKDEEIESLWKSLLEIDDTLDFEDQTSKSIKNKVNMIIIFADFIYYLNFTNQY
jgi:hypothetical protein